MSPLDRIANCTCPSTVPEGAWIVPGAAMGRGRGIGYVENRIYGNDPELGIYERWPIYATPTASDGFALHDNS